MSKIILTLTLLTACGPSRAEAPPMSGTCIDRETPNLLNSNAANILFKECRWQGEIWICRIEKSANAWRCVAVGQAN